MINNIPICQPDLPKIFADLRHPSLLRDVCECVKPSNISAVKSAMMELFDNIATTTESEKIITSTLTEMIQHNIIIESIDIGFAQPGQNALANYSFAYLSVYLPREILGTFDDWVQEEYADGEGSDIHVYVCNAWEENELRKLEKTTGRKVALEERRARERYRNVTEKSLGHIMVRFPTDALGLLPAEVADEFTMNFTAVQLMYCKPGNNIHHLTSRFRNIIARCK